MPDASIVVEIRKPDQTTHTRSRFGEFLASAGGAAIVTVLLGGVAGQLISCNAQRRLQEREFNNAWLKARGDQALTARKEFVEGRTKALDEILRVAGAIATASDDLLYITRPSFDTKGQTIENKKLVLAEQTRVFSEYVKAEQAWAPSQPRFTFAASYYSNGDTSVLAAWRELRSEVNVLRTCASDTYERWHQAGRRIGTYTYDPAKCRLEYDAVSSAIERLGTAFMANESQPWHGWDNPKSLKETLGIE